MAKTSIVVQFDPAVEARLAALSQDRDVSEVAAGLLSSFVDPDSFEHKRICQGLAELEAGNSISSERVMELLDSWSRKTSCPRRNEDSLASGGAGALYQGLASALPPADPKSLRALAPAGFSPLTRPRSG